MFWELACDLIWSDSFHLCWDVQTLYYIYRGISALHPSDMSFSIWQMKNRCISDSDKKLERWVRNKIATTQTQHSTINTKITWQTNANPCSNFMGYAVPDNRVHGANMGPSWVPSAPDGPHVGPMNLVIRGNSLTYSSQPPSHSSQKQAKLGDFKYCIFHLGIILILPHAELNDVEEFLQFDQTGIEVSIEEYFQSSPTDLGLLLSKLLLPLQ